MEESIITFVLVGFFAQIIDGALGMAYGVTSTTFLLSLGISPAAASASVHAAEIATTGVSGLSHWKLGNVDRVLFQRLVLPGVLGGVLGAYVLTNLPDDVIRPYVAGYMLIMGGMIIHRGLKRIHVREVKSKLVPLGFIGGFMDAIGGGGWGPVVTSTLVARGNNPRLTIGSVNLAEFFVTVSQSAVFFLTIGLTHGTMIVGLIAGGVVAAPFAALISRRLPSHMLMVVVGLLVVVLSIRTLYLALS